jgi:type II secretory pathway pseudopilin PulG
LTPVARLRGERGESLVEILLTLSIMGICFVAILLGVATVYTGTDTHRQEASTEAVLRTYAESIKDPQDVAYIDCTTDPNPGATYDAAVKAAGFVVPTGFTASVTGVTYWDGNDPPAFGVCPARDQGVQQVTLRVVSPHGPHGADETLTIVKRRTS